MKNTLILLTLLAVSGTARCQTSADSVFVSGIYAEILGNGECYDNLRTLCKGIGHRIAGSPQADSAIVWGKAALDKIGLDSVYLMPVEVPRWVRGRVETCSYTTDSGAISIPVTALGGSVGTNGKITSEVIEVKSLDELSALGKRRIDGRIVFFNKAMDPLLINTGAAYGGAYDVRSKGPSEAARFGAVACIIRSLTLAEDKYPHTGGTQYDPSLPKIPAAAISSVDARALSKVIKENPATQLSLELDCQDFPRIIQYNVIGEIRGIGSPHEYIVVGGHLDSWDVGEGAHDDGSGIVQSIEVMRAFKSLGYKPQHSIRCVLFINEEFGNDGGITYARISRELGQTHIAAVESDGGGFTPRGFSMQGSDKQFEWLKSLSPLFEPYNIHLFRQGWSGVDITPLKDDRAALFGLLVDNQRYFDYHHSNNDVFEQVNRRELELGAASMAALIYLLDQSGIPAQ